MLSHKSKYALKGAIALAREFGQGPVLVSDIAIQFLRTLVYLRK
jgi:hypothetical protein